MKIILTLLLLTSSCFAADFPSTEQDCLAANIYHEARGESPHGQWLVAYVTKNRIDSKYFPDKYCRVVKQHKQFSWWEDPAIVKKPEDPWAWATACDIAKHFINQDLISKIDGSLGALYYHKITIRPYWVDSKEYLGRVGLHYAYKDKER